MEECSPPEIETETETARIYMAIIIIIRRILMLRRRIHMYIASTKKNFHQYGSEDYKKEHAK